MVSDPIADMLIRIKNASMAGRVTVLLGHSNIKEAVAKILQQEGYIANVVVDSSESETRKKIVLTLKYENKKSVITDVKRKSKPGRRQYIPHSAIPRVLGGMGTAILSTSTGIMTGREAQKKGIGGELLCEIW
jgi:small subunit ribosomal protein S8